MTKKKRKNTRKVILITPLIKAKKPKKKVKSLTALLEIKD